MQAQTAKTKGELLYEIHSKNETTTIKDIGPNGIAMEMNDHGEFKGKLQGGHMNTVSINVKADGTSEWSVKSILNTKDGDMVVVWGGGKGKMANPQIGTWEGELHFQTQSPKLAYLNSTTGWVEGSGNMATRESSAKVYTKK